MQPQTESRSQARQQAGAPAEHEQSGRARRGRFLQALGGRLSGASERFAERVGERQIPKLLESRSRVETELRAIPQRIEKVAKQANLVLELIDDYRSGSYREVSWRSIAIGAAALVYSVSPGDVVPDFVPLLGALDDTFVVALAMRLVRRDLERYCRFKGYAPEQYFD